MADKINEVESRQARATDSRYCERIYRNKEDTGSRYNLLEQLLDYDYDYEDMEWNEELARINLREGLKYDKTLPVNNANHPWIYFSPKCPQLIRAIKYYSRLKSTTDNPQLDAVHKAAGLMILSEPIWMPGLRANV